ELGYHPEVILSGRRINDGMGNFVASSIIKEMIKKKINIQESVINILGLTFKENTPDLRNTRVMDIIEELKDYGLNVVVHDALANKEDAKKFYDIELVELNDLKTSDVLVLAVSHAEYLENKNIYLEKLDKNGIIFDIKGVFSQEDLKENQTIWSL